MDFQDLRAMTLLSFKYDVPHIQEEVRRRLQVCYPSTLEQWDLRYPPAYPSDPQIIYEGSPKDTLSVKPIDCITVINLARRFNLDELLPAAFYTCTLIPQEDLVA